MDYKEKLRLAKEALDSGSYDKETIEYIFPELKESEDERIRQFLIQEVTETSDEIMSYRNMNKKDVLAWLKKQGEDEYIDPDTLIQQRVDALNDIIADQKLTDKVEPKFKVGDWTVSNLDRKARQISEVHFDEYNSYYVIDGKSVNLEAYDRLHHLWTIQDAKDGDVLVHIGCTFIFMGVKNGIVQALEKYLLEGTNPVPFGEPDKDNDYYPATKEQRDALIKAMADIGYTFDFEKKELKKIEQKPVSNQFTPEQANVLDKHIDKFLEQKKPTWSEEDERTYKSITYSFAHNYPLTVQQQEFVKSIKERYTWKPSDKQLNNLLDVLSFDNCTLKRRELLESLYNDLKKLKD